MAPQIEPRHRRYLVAGVVVVSVALWLILDSLGVGVPPLRRFWPIFAVIGGLASIVDYLIGGRVPASLGKGVAGIGVGILFFAFTYGQLSWLEVGDWLPALPLITGAGLLATWFGGNRTPPFLVLGVVGVALGATFYVDNFAWLERLMPPPALVWGVLLLVLGGYLVWRSVRRSRGSQDQ